MPLISLREEEVVMKGSTNMGMEERMEGMPSMLLRPLA